MSHSEEKVKESIRFIKEHTQVRPEIALILGSGLGDFAETLHNRVEIQSRDIPHYPPPTVEGHRGALVFGNLQSKTLVVFQGRVHFYEWGAVERVLYPVNIARGLGASVLIVTNAAGGVNRSFRPGDLMVITDHINLTAETASHALATHVRRRPEWLYSKALADLAMSAAQKNAITLRQGVYAGVKGPSYETAAEVELVHRIGGDAVGMSTVLEVEHAAALGFKVLGMSCITNYGTGISRSRLDHTEVARVANRVKREFSLLLSSIISEI